MKLQLWMETVLPLIREAADRLDDFSAVQRHRAAEQGDPDKFEASARGAQTLARQLRQFWAIGCDSLE